jgi:transcriptional regulator with XRE-family HTH domain
MVSFKDRIKELRTQNKLTLRELGEKLGYSESTMSMYESGKRQPKNADDYIRIADFFDVSVDYLMGKAHRKEPFEKAGTDTTQTIALHRTDGYDDDLPEEAIKEIENFKEFIRQKYKKK